MNVGLQPMIDPLPRSDRTAADNGSAADAVICTLQRSSKPGAGAGERRRDARYAFPHPIHLTPLDDNGQPNAAASLIVMGRQISERGLDFYHAAPLYEKKVIASFKQAGVWLSFLLELQWCRFHSSGWCENGGRFLHSVETPLDCLAPQYDFNSLLETS